MKIQNNPMDERQIQITVKALAISGIFLGLCIAASMIYKMVALEIFGWEFWALVGACLVFVCARGSLGDVEQPKNFMNKPIPTGNTPEERRIRKKDCAIQSLMFAGFCTALDILLVVFGGREITENDLSMIFAPVLGKGLSIAISLVVSIGLRFIITYLVYYMIIDKYKVKKYNDMIDQLEED